jgi:outer membrane protein OmpA-like peptidoglycan-associated protein
MFICTIGYSQPFSLMDTDVKPGQFQHFHQIHFGVGSPHLQITSLAQLDSMVYFLKRNPTLKIELGVHTDFRGDDRQNLELSKKRAVSVRKYLVENGIISTRIKAIGFGETKPVIDYQDWKKLTDTHRCGYFGSENSRVTVVVKSA